MTKTYSRYADICAKFYSLTINSEETADFIFNNSRVKPGQDALFVGGMFDIAHCLNKRGLNITLVDYTDEMVEVGRSKLPQVPIAKADLRELHFENQFDIVFVVGRVFTHMLSQDDLSKAILSCKKSLKNGGHLFADNYENTRIQVTPYFNGEIQCTDSNSKIIRKSTTTKISDFPYIIRWDADYSGHMKGENFNFSDSINHRAFSRSEFATDLEKLGFSVVQQGDNFDETSFFTLAKKHT
jgi:SAM-dependent methyltransferase